MMVSTSEQLIDSIGERLKTEMDINGQGELGKINLIYSVSSLVVVMQLLEINFTLIQCLFD